MVKSLVPFVVDVVVDVVNVDNVINVNNVVNDITTLLMLLMFIYDMFCFCDLRSGPLAGLTISVITYVKPMEGNYVTFSSQ